MDTEMMDEKTIRFIHEHEKDDVHSLLLQAKRYPDIDVPFAAMQVKGRQIAREKIPSWYAVDTIVYPPHISLEQASSEKTAVYKASLCSGDSLTDLTGGLGVDFAFMSRKFKSAMYVEKLEKLAEIARHNFHALQLKNAEVICCDAVDYLKEMPRVDIIYLDPARRDTHGRKTVRIEDCTPNLVEIESQLEEKCKRAIFKLSPMLDISLALQSLHNITEVHIVSHNNECKELLFVKEKGMNTSPVFHCVNLLADDMQVFTSDKETEEKTNIIYTDQIGSYLYEPNASILKGGFYKSIASAYNLQKLHPNSHLYTSGTLVEGFQGRIFSVKEIIGFSKKNLKELSRQTTKANITVRNFPLSVEEIRRQTGIKDGGDLYIFATTSASNDKILIVGEKIK